MDKSFKCDTAPRRSGFTLIELLAVMLLILTVLGMGVPAMFAAERKSYVNQAMNDLIRVHQACMAMQRELAARGDGGVVTMSIVKSDGSAYSASPDASPYVTVTISTGAISPSTWMSRTLPISINSDDFISTIGSNGGYSWSYQKQTSFMASDSSGSTTMAGPITLTYKCLPTGGDYKVKRDLVLYPQGYSEVP